MNALVNCTLVVTCEVVGSTISATWNGAALTGRMTEMAAMTAQGGGIIEPVDVQAALVVVDF